MLPDGSRTGSSSTTRRVPISTLKSIRRAAASANAKYPTESDKPSADGSDQKSDLARIEDGSQHSELRSEVAGSLRRAPSMGAASSRVLSRAGSMACSEHVSEIEQQILFNLAERSSSLSVPALSHSRVSSVSRLGASGISIGVASGACVFPAQQAIVVGGGLAGFSAAHTVVEHGGKCLLLDKSPFCGGNSTKATSGINGAETKTQKTQGIKDTNDIFIADTLKGGAKKPEVAKVLCTESGPGVDWLVDKFELDLSLIARLGGHSMPRTHRGKERFPGMTITYALMQRFEKIAETSDRAKIINKARVFRLICNNDCVVGCEYEKAGENLKAFGPLILCSGGFGADFSNDSLLAKYRPDLLHLPTTNGEHCTGDAIKMGEAIGANSVDLEWVQVHPTGLVKPDDPDAKIKFLAAEALRGVGGLVFDANGKRFANELGRRDYVTGEMWKNKPPFRLVLNKAASEEIMWHCKHYTGRGVMKFYESGAKLAEDMGVSLQTLVDEHDRHYEAAEKTNKDPDGGSWPAYPSGKSWDEPSGKTGSGKKFYHNVIAGKEVATQPFYVAIITPVIHYCMGGLETTVLGECVKGSEALPGLYVAGEAAGGVHGNNRLGGNSLLDCVVFGRVAGRNCAKFMFGAGGEFRMYPIDASDKAVSNVIIS